MSRRKPRFVPNVEAGAPAGWRWFVRHVVGGVNPIAIRTDDGFTVLREDRWAEALQAAEAREVAP